MKRRALVITRTPVFGDQVVQALELDGRFGARAYHDLNVALEDGRHEPFDLVILDANGADLPLEHAARALRQVCPSSALILVPPGDWVRSTLVNQIAPDGMLTKPLSLKDLTDLLDDVFQRFFGNNAPATATNPPDADTPTEIQKPLSETERPLDDAPAFERAISPAEMARPSSSNNRNSNELAGRGLIVIRKGAAQGSDGTRHGWLYDVSRAAQYLARLSMETSAQAALIVRGGKIWAYAGQVSQEDAQELSQVVTSQWNRPEQGAGNARSTMRYGGSVQNDRHDLVRFTRLANEQEYILYATGLVDNLVLALAFDAGVPFRMIRAQALHLAQALAQPPETNHRTETPSDQGQHANPLPAEQPFEPAAFSADVQSTHATGDLVANGSSNNNRLPSLLMDVPPSNPGRSGGGQSGGESISTSRSSGAKVQDGQEPPSQSEEAPPSRSGLNGYTMPSGLPISPAILHTGRPDLDNQDETAAPPPSLQNPVGNYAPQNHVGQSSIGLEPVTPALSGLMYTCVMVPRIPTHTISGDLATRLAEWMPLLCLAYGWRLEKLEQRKEYLAWVVRVQLNTSPSHLMRILRQKTSLRIFADFPVLARENPSGDFWAPGYLILSSGALPSPDVIRSFIQQTRFYQGGTGPIILSSTR